MHTVLPATAEARQPADHSLAGVVAHLTRIAGWGVCLALLLLAYGYGLGSIPLLNYTEGLYAEIAREMLAGGSWIIPHLDGSVYLDKPPLFYWLEAGSFALFGLHAWTARLVSALAALAGCAAVWLVTARLGLARIGRWAALILAGMPGWLIMAHTASFDALLAMLIAGSLLGFFAADLTGRIGWARWGYALAALGYLTKGPVAPVLVGATMLVFLAWEGRLRDLWRLLDLAGIMVFLVVAGPWTVLAALREPNFLSHFFLVEQFGRYLGTRRPVDYGSGPLWYYLPWIAAAAAPWILVGPLARWQAGPPRAAAERRLAHFGIAWAATVVVFFSLSVDKGNYYILPALPGIALAAAGALRRWFDMPSSARCRLVLAPVPLCALCAAAASLLLWQGHGWLAAGGMVGIALAFLGWAFAARYRRLAAALSLVVLVPVATGAFASLGSAAPLQRSQRLARVIQHSPHPRAPVVLYRHYDPFGALPFLLRRRVWVLQPHSAELYFAARWQPRRRPFLRRRGFAALLRRGPVWILASARYRPELLRQLPQGCTRTRAHPGATGRLIFMLPACPRLATQVPGRRILKPRLRLAALRQPRRSR
ncbi:MAG: glycosyltransferase family 39 protein [Gammaproteobacteria bacterium]